MDELDELLIARVADFDDPTWIGYALARTLVSLDREQRAIQLAGWRDAAAAGIPIAQTALREADRFLLRLHAQVALALHGDA
jgi:hypothetical protein